MGGWGGALAELWEASLPRWGQERARGLGVQSFADRVTLGNSFNVPELRVHHQQNGSPSLSLPQERPVFWATLYVSLGSPANTRVLQLQQFCA